MLSSYIILAMSLFSVGLANPGRACGFKIAPCPDNTVCVPTKPKCTDLNKCPGVCSKKYSSCGGFTLHPKKCNTKSLCVDDPRFTAMYGLVADLPGICISKKVKTCPKIGGKGCPQGLRCYDDPRDTCYPYHDDKGCSGVCL